MNSINDHDKIMSDRNLFNKTVYTPLSEAIKILEERQKDPILKAKIEKLLDGDIPEPLNKLGKYAVLFRQIATPNHESQCFHSLAKDYKLSPVFFEYFDDKFTSNNDFKYSLGRIHIQGPINKKNYFPMEKVTIINFNKYNGKKLKNVLTTWGEPLIDFHKKLFKLYNNTYDIKFYNLSNWFENNGGKAVNYYVNFFLLFTCFGILFENFLLDDNYDNNGKFTKEVVLPALEKVVELTGIKPIIVPITPLDIEKDNYWISYNRDVKKNINNI